MGRKTSVYLADDILAALADDPRPLAEVIRAGLGISDQAVALAGFTVATVFGDVYGAGLELRCDRCGDDIDITVRRGLMAMHEDVDLVDLAGAAAAHDAAKHPAAPAVGRGRTPEQVGQLRAHGGEIILAEPGQPEPEPELGPRTIKLGGEDA